MLSVAICVETNCAVLLLWGMMVLFLALFTYILQYGIETIEVYIDDDIMDERFLRRFDVD